MRSPLIKITPGRGMAALAVLSAIVFFNSLGGGYFLDDETIYLDDPQIRHGSLASAFGNRLPKFIPSGFGYRYYRPGAILTHMVLARLFPENPFAIRMFSVAAHTAAGVLVFLLLLHFMDWKPAWVAAALFLVHPLHVEAVAWMAAVPEIVAACFVLLSLWAMLQATPKARTGGPWWAALSYAAAAAALLTKETALALPLLAVLVLAWHGERPWRAWPYFAVAAGTLAMRILTVGFFSTPPVAPSLRENLLILASAAVHHTVKLIWPWPLATEYELHQPVSAWIAAACICAAAVWLAWRFKQTRWPVLLAVVALLPGIAFSTILPAMRQVQDRHAYIAVLGLTVLVALACDRPSGRALAAVLLVLWSTMSIVAIRHWRDTEAVWTRALQVTPNSKNAVLGLGDWYNATGRYQDAERIYEYGLKVHPGDREIVFSRAANRKNLRPAGGAAPR